MPESADPSFYSNDPGSSFQGLSDNTIGFDPTILTDMIPPTMIQGFDSLSLASPGQGNSGYPPPVAAQSGESSSSAYQPEPATGSLKCPECTESFDKQHKLK